MKKLSLVMAAAMCMTVGGVYATWQYATETVNDEAVVHGITVDMTTPTTDNSSAVTISYDGTPDIKFQIDGADYTEENASTLKNTAVLEYSGSAKVKIVFSESSSTQTITITYEFLLKNAQYTSLDGTTYNAIDIFTLTPPSTSTTSTTTAGAISVVWSETIERDADNISQIELTSGALIEATGLKLTEAFNLANRAEFNNFQSYLTTVAMSINVGASIATTAAGA